MSLRSPAGLTAIGIGATLVVTAAVVVVLLLFGGAKAISDNAALIGALIALGGVFTTQLVNSVLEAQRAEQARETEHAQRERELEVGSQRAQDDAVQAYLDQMTELLLDKDRPLRQSKEGDEVRTLARARTLTVLSRLDGVHKGNVVQFLYESQLIHRGSRVVDLIGADLRGADLRGAQLYEANFLAADLREADLSEADIRGAVLYADLRGVHLSKAHLDGADLSGADLSGTDLSGVDFKGADLSGAILSDAIFNDADLTNVSLDLPQLASVGSFEGTTMPNGDKYGPWIEDVLKEYRVSSKEDE